MKMLWCWRCKTEVPMLDDDEYRQVMTLLPVGKAGGSLHTMFTPMLAEYERITGLRETNPKMPCSTIGCRSMGLRVGTAPNH